jgi:hypothetical protein
MAQSFEPAGLHHLTPIEEVIGYTALKDGALLVFRDERGIQVTLQLQSTAIRSLLQALVAGPTPAQE